MRSILCTILCMLLLAAMAPAAIASDEGTEVGNYAPLFELADLSARPHSLAQLRGNAVLLAFWSTLCSPCTAELPSLNRLADSLREEGVVVLAVSIDTSDKPVRDFVAQHGISLTILLDRDKEVFFDRYAGPSLPISFLINKHGMIIHKFDGPQNWDAASVKPLIQKAIK